MSDSLDRLQAVFNNVFNGRLNITMETAMKDEAEWDSVEHLNLIDAIEQEFGMSFEIGQIVELDTVAKIVEIIDAHAVKAAS